MKSFEKLKPLIPNMVEIILSDLTFFRYQMDDDEFGTFRSQEAIIKIISDILETIATTSTKLMKLKLSNMYLRNNKLIDSLGDVIENSPNLIFLDVSRA